jgi:SAM-dependent MidA family methyltransferase
MRYGVRVGPFWASTGGYRRRHRIGVLGAWFILSPLAGNWFGTTVGVWLLWTGIPAPRTLCLTSST